jgi:hypothetical protein
MKSFQIIMEAGDEELSFEESKVLKKQLQNEEYEYDEAVKVSQKRKELNEDEAGGVMEAIIEIACAAPAIYQVASVMGKFILNKWKKNKPTDVGKEIGLSIQMPDGSVVTIDKSLLQKSDNNTESFISNIAQILQSGKALMG